MTYSKTAEFQIIYIKKKETPSLRIVVVPKRNDLCIS